MKNGRLGEANDIANVVLSLASAQPQWVTGQTIRINGGFIYSSLDPIP